MMRNRQVISGRERGMLGLIAGAQCGRAAVRPGRQRHRDQDRQYQSLQRAGLGLWRDRPRDQRLFRQGQRRGRDQRPPDRVHHARRRLQPAAHGRADPQAGRAGRGAAGLPVARHADQHRDPPVHERQEGAASVRRDRRHQMGPARQVPLDHGLAAQLPERGQDLRALHPRQPARCQDRRALPERRLRQGLSRGLQGRARRAGRAS